MNGLKCKTELWIATTPDEYEFPIAIAESNIELAAILGYNPCTISKLKRKTKEGRPRNMKIFTVKYKEGELNEV